MLEDDRFAACLSRSVIQNQNRTSLKWLQLQSLTMTSTLKTVLSIPFLFPSITLQFISLFLVAVDKFIAKFHAPLQRVPESIFITLAFFGGWPGFILGCILCRHKTSRRNKRTFQKRIVLAIVSAVILKVYFLYWIYYVYPRTRQRRRYRY